MTRVRATLPWESGSDKRRFFITLGGRKPMTPPVEMTIPGEGEILFSRRNHKNILSTKLSGPEESWACGPPRVMKNASVRHPLSMEPLPSPCHPDRSEAERRDLRFRRPFVETLNSNLKQNCHLACPGVPWDRSVSVMEKSAVSSSVSDADELALYRSRHHSPAGLSQHIYLAAHSKFREIDSRFHGEAGVGQDQALVVGFEVVEVGSVAVGFGGDAMPRPMGEVLSEAGTANHRTGSVVGLPPC